MDELDYGPVFITAGRFKGRVMYYDDDESKGKIICYAGHPIQMVRCYNVPRRSVREPSITDLLDRAENISRTINRMAVRKDWPSNTADLHELWSERQLIEGELRERRTLGEIEHTSGETTVFLCHTSTDKGWVRRVNDDLRRLGVKTWIDENNIKVGESIIGKISDTLQDTQIMIVFLSKDSIKSLWTKREWQSFLSRQLAGNKIKILPALLEDCEIPSILSDLKYANFSESYYDGLKELRASIE